MEYHIVVKQEAIEDIRLAFHYYEGAVGGLGEDFLSEVDEYILIIESNPYLFEQKHKPFREVKINRFPYLIIYEIDEKQVIIYAVFHTSQSPKMKYRK